MKKILFITLLCFMACIVKAGVVPTTLTIHYDTNTKATFDFYMPASIELTVKANIPVTKTYTSFIYTGGVLFMGTVTVTRPAILKITGYAGTSLYTKTLGKGSNVIPEIDGPFIENFGDKTDMPIYITITYIND